LLQGFSTIASLLLALNESTLEDIRACINSENPPSAYKADLEHFQEVVDATLKEHNQTLTRHLLESVHSGYYRPFATIGSFGAHTLSTFREFYQICGGDCKLQGPREFVLEDHYHSNVLTELKKLIEKHPLDEEAGELKKFIDIYLPLEKLHSGKSKGDRAYLEYLKAFGRSLFEFRAKLVATTQRSGFLSESVVYSRTFSEQW
jgi:hypothetical protein